MSAAGKTQLLVVPFSFMPCSTISSTTCCYSSPSICRVCPAEELPFEDGSVDLLASFTAAHWFDIGKFMNEVKRVLRPGGCVAISTYTIDMSLHYGDCSEKLTQIFREVREGTEPWGSPVLGRGRQSGGWVLRGEAMGGGVEGLLWGEGSRGVIEVYMPQA